MNNNFLGIWGHYKTHMDGLKQFNSKSVTYTYIGCSEHNLRGQPIVQRLVNHEYQTVNYNYILHIHVSGFLFCSILLPVENFFSMAHSKL